MTIDRLSGPQVQLLLHNEHMTKAEITALISELMMSNDGSAFTRKNDHAIRLFWDPMRESYTLHLS